MTTITLTGNKHYTQYTVGSTSADIIDATDALWSQNNDVGVGLSLYPFYINGLTKALVIYGGVINGETSLTEDWETLYDIGGSPGGNSAGVFVKDIGANLVTIRNWRISRAWDGIRVTGTTGSFLIEDCWINTTRDDAVENDDALAGTYSDCLFENHFTGLSYGDAGTTNFAKDIFHDGLLLHMKKHVYDPGTGDVLTHQSPFKMNTNLSLANNPKMYFNNCVVAISDENHLGQSRLQYAWDRQQAGSTGNFFLNLSDTPVAGGYPLPGSGWTVQQGATARATWAAAKAAWIAAHYPTTDIWRPSWRGFRIEGASGARTVALPGPLLQNDIILVFGARDTAMADPTITTSGYTYINDNEAGSGPANFIAYKRMGATPDTDIGLTQLTGDVSACSIWLLRNVDATTAIDATSSIASAATGAPDVGSLTTNFDGSMRVAIGMLDDDDVAGIVTVPSGWSGLTAYDTAVGSAGNAGATVMAAYLISPSAGAADPAVFGGAIDNAWRALQVAFRKTGGAGGGSGMTLVTRAGKGSELTHAEMDGNWAHVNPQGPHAVPVPAVSMSPTGTAGATFAETSTATNGRMIRGYSFSASTPNYVEFEFPVPKSVAEGTFTALIGWTHPAASTNFGTAWSIAALACGDGDAQDAALGTAVVVTDTGGATGATYPRYLAAVSGAVTPAGSWVEGDLLRIRIGRETANAFDDLAVAAILTDVKLIVTTNAGTDA